MAPKGTYDVLPNAKDEWRQPHLWKYIENTICELSALFGFEEVRTPIFEKTELFTRTVGEESDIVTKEMYTFLDKGERSMTLRPEGTAPICRAYIDGGLSSIAGIQKLYYLGPMFRYERPQSGRFRQLSQFGAEGIGTLSPTLDVEIISFLYTFFERLGLKNLTVNINSIGDDPAPYREALRAFLKPRLRDLSAESQMRFEKNVLRILDSKDPKDQEILKEVPSILDYLSDESAKHFETVLTLLKECQIPYTINPKIVRGLDYYTRTVFEITSGELGAQNAIGAGGRYDKLIKELGGPDTPAIGFAAGLERTLLVLLKQQCQVPSPLTPKLFFIAMGEAAQAKALSLMQTARRAGISCDIDFEGKKLQKALSLAEKKGAQYAAIIGDEEIAQNSVKLKNMEKREEKLVPFSALAKEVGHG